MSATGSVQSKEGVVTQEWMGEQVEGLNASTAGTPEENGLVCFGDARPVTPRNAKHTAKVIYATQSMVQLFSPDWYCGLATANDVDIQDLGDFLVRHYLGDWGSTPAEDARRNDKCLSSPARAVEEQVISV